jgi:large subunit ribosomal protein L13
MSPQVLESSEERLVVDGADQILGRLASIVAKKLMGGQRVVIVNAEKIVVSGPKNRVIQGYKLMFRLRTMYNPLKQGVRRPRDPIRLVRKAVKGMLPKNRESKEMMRRLKVYVGLPRHLEGVKGVKFNQASKERLRGEYLTLGELAKELGWHNE